MLANDSDIDSTTLTVAVVTAPAPYGTLTLNADGSFVYKPAANYSGTKPPPTRPPTGTAAPLTVR